MRKKSWTTGDDGGSMSVDDAGWMLDQATVVDAASADADPAMTQPSDAGPQPAAGPFEAERDLEEALIREALRANADAAVTEAWSAGQWYLDRTGGGLDLNVDEVWRDYTGRGVTVAVYDDGVQGIHPRPRRQLRRRSRDRRQPRRTGRQ